MSPSLKSISSQINRTVFTEQIPPEETKLKAAAEYIQVLNICHNKE